MPTVNIEPAACDSAEAKPWVTGSSMRANPTTKHPAHRASWAMSDTGAVDARTTSLPS